LVTEIPDSVAVVRIVLDGVGGDGAPGVGFQNAAAVADQRFQAAVS
jgi:hypothetical protein